MQVNLVGLIRAYGGELASRAPDKDLISGSHYDMHGGVSALLFQRQVGVAEEIFRNCSINTASGRFNEIAQARFAEQPAEAAPGVGTAVLRRTGSTSGTLYKGTYFEMLSPSQSVTGFLIDEDLEVTNETEVTVQIRAATVSGQPCSYSGRGRLVDSTWDPSWVPVSVSVGAGVEKETREQFLARVTNQRWARRPGYSASIKATLLAAGAAHVELFRAGIELPNSGLSRAVVGDASYEASDALLDACRLAVENASAGGCDLQIHGMTKVSLSVRAKIAAWSRARGVQGSKAVNEAKDAIFSYFEATRTSPFLFSHSAIAAAIHAAVLGQRVVEVTTNVAEPTLGTIFRPLRMSRYWLNNVTVTPL